MKKYRKYRIVYLIIDEDEIVYATSDEDEAEEYLYMLYNDHIKETLEEYDIDDFNDNTMSEMAFISDFDCCPILEKVDLLNYKRGDDVTVGDSYFTYDEIISKLIRSAHILM